MRVIYELIRHLFRRHLLDAADIDRLMATGMIDDADLYNLDPHHEIRRHVADLADPVEEPEPGARRRTAGRSARPRPERLRATDIDALILAVRPRLEADLAGLVAMARGLDSAAGLDEAPRLLTACSDRELTGAMEHLATARPDGLALLLRGMLVDSYRLGRHDIQTAARDGPAGPALHAFDAALSGVSPGDLGSHGWILRQPAIAWAADLLRTQRRMAAMLQRLIAADAAAIRRPLQPFDPAAYWLLATCLGMLRDTGLRSGHGLIVARRHPLPIDGRGARLIELVRAGDHARFVAWRDGPGETAAAVLEQLGGGGNVRRMRLPALDIWDAGHRPPELFA